MVQDAMQTADALSATKKRPKKAAIFSRAYWQNEQSAKTIGLRQRSHGRTSSLLALLGQFFSSDRSRSANAGRWPLKLRRGRRSCASEQNGRYALASLALPTA